MKCDNNMRRTAIEATHAVGIVPPCLGKTRALAKGTIRPLVKHFTFDKYTTSGFLRGNRGPDLLLSLLSYFSRPGPEPARYEQPQGDRPHGHRHAAREQERGLPP